MNGLKLWQKLCIAASIIVLAYFSTLTHLLLIEGERSIYMSLILGGVFTVFTAALVFAINMLAWGIDYESENGRP